MLSGDDCAKIFIIVSILAILAVSDILLSAKAAYHFSNYRGQPPIHIYGAASKTSLDKHFASKYGAVFFASSGDNGYGASWPASSPNVIAVGGTSLELNKNRSFTKEIAWSGSGGGVSAYEKSPDFQVGYDIPKSHNKRAIPDVSYNADPKSGFSVVHNGVWRIVGGTSAGAPQWAAIAALGSGISNVRFYADKSGENNGKYFRDIKSGSNGDCGYYCEARKHYDYITGLGSPLTANF